MLLLTSVLKEEFPEASQIMLETLKWTLENMHTEEGWFLYKIVDILGKKVKIKIPYIRWRQAWMLRALALAAAELSSS